MRALSLIMVVIGLVEFSQTACQYKPHDKPDASQPIADPCAEMRIEIPAEEKTTDADGSSLDCNSIFEAAQKGDIEQLRTLIREGCDIEKRWAKHGDRITATPLQRAIYFRQEEASILLICNGADVNSRNQFNRTPLHYAAEENLPNVVQYLVDFGADVNAFDKKGNTPLIDAAYSGKIEIERILRRAGARLPRVSYGSKFKNRLTDTGITYDDFHDHIRVCYLDALARHPRLVGTLSIELAIGDQGDVNEATVTEANLYDDYHRTPEHDAEMEACLLRRMKSVKYRFSIGRTPNPPNFTGFTAEVYISLIPDIFPRPEKPLPLPQEDTANFKYYGFAEDFSWLSGRLEWCENIRGWIIHYLPKAYRPSVIRDILLEMPPWSFDAHEQGRFDFRLPPDVEGYKSGDWVRVTGEILFDVPTVAMIGPIYRSWTIERIGPPRRRAFRSSEEERLTVLADRFRENGQKFPLEFDPHAEMKLYGYNNLYMMDVKESLQSARAEYLSFRDEVISSDLEPFYRWRDFSTSSTDLYHRFTLFKVLEKKPDLRYAMHLFYETRILRDAPLTRAPLLLEICLNRVKKRARKPRYITYLYPRPDFLRGLAEEHNNRHEEKGEILFFSKDSTSSKARFTKAADLLVYCRLQDQHSRDGTILLEYSVSELRNAWRWSGIIAVNIYTPTSDRDWEFKKVQIDVDKNTGRVTTTRKDIEF